MISEIKKQLRASYINVGSDINERVKEIVSAEIVKRIEASAVFRDARVVALYNALPYEVQLGELLDRWAGVKRLALPSTAFEEMVFQEYTGPEDLGVGRFGIVEPVRGRIIPPQEIELMIVPGVAFDREGHRLGRGAGYYDRYLSSPNASGIYKMGVCLPWLLVESVPTMPHDIAMDEVITNE
ncbi:MAG: 5-formyltetrahydrofolate cyclo-ligase [Rikenellaceae bacterium]|jgi:5-formyltetrahydrofolate cyclo-ligase|nr:5-formyltetrahydrofolate cyclo-ligase [Rikenellaceae bacterium]